MLFLCSVFIFFYALKSQHFTKTLNFRENLALLAGPQWGGGVGLPHPETRSQEELLIREAERRQDEPRRRDRREVQQRVRRDEDFPRIRVEDAGFEERQNQPELHTDMVDF